MKILLVFVLSLIVLTGMAQPPKNGNAKTPVVKKIKPKLTTRLGNYTDSATIGVDELTALILNPLQIADDKKNAYAITTYGLMYTRQGVTENEDLDKTSPATSSISSRFTTTPFPEIWMNNIRSQLKPGEELYFYDVVVKDAQGKLWFAPNLKLRSR